MALLHHRTYVPRRVRGRSASPGGTSRSERVTARIAAGGKVVPLSGLRELAQAASVFSAYPGTMGRTPIKVSWLRPARDAAILACLLFATAHLLGLTQLGGDAHSYWLADPLDPYHSVTPGQGNSHFYSPAFTQALWPFHGWPWELFITFGTLVLTAALVWQAGLWTAPVFLLFPYVPLDLMYGNIHLLLGAAIVLGFRWPWAWSFVLLTKITPGIGLLWFAARREWRSLAIAGAATLAIAGVSFVIAPALWWKWVDTLVGATSAPQPGWMIPIPLPVRLGIAAALVVWGARADHRWTVVVASTIALPASWLNGWAMLVGVIPLLAAEVGTTPASRFLAAESADRLAAPVAPALAWRA